jgi:hypothetical protein
MLNLNLKDEEIRFVKLHVHLKEGDSPSFELFLALLKCRLKWTSIAISRNRHQILPCIFQVHYQLVNEQ